METQKFDRIEAKEICLTDSMGRTRIRLRVDSHKVNHFEKMVDAGKVEIFDELGKAMAQIEQYGSGAEIRLQGGAIALTDSRDRARLLLAAGGCEGEKWFSGAIGNGGGTIELKDKDEDTIYQVIEDDRGVAVIESAGLRPAIVAAHKTT